MIKTATRQQLDRIGRALDRVDAAAFAFANSDTSHTRYALVCWIDSAKQAGSHKQDISYTVQEAFNRAGRPDLHWFVV